MRGGGEGGGVRLLHVKLCVACGCPCVFVLIIQFCYLLPLFDLLKLCPPSSDSSRLTFSLLLPTLSTVQSTSGGVYVPCIYTYAR